MSWRVALLVAVGCVPASLLFADIFPNSSYHLGSYFMRVIQASEEQHAVAQSIDAPGDPGRKAIHGCKGIAAELRVVGPTGKR